MLSEDFHTASSQAAYHGRTPTGLNPGSRSIIRNLLALAATATAAAGLATAPAHADQYDFISELDSKGVYYRDIIGMMELGKKTCYNLRTGTPLGGILRYLVQQEGFAGYEAATIVGAAATNMCPDAIPYLESQLNTPAPPG